MRSSFNSSMDSAMYRSSESNYAIGILGVDNTNGLSGIGLLMQQDDGAGSPVYIKSVVPGGSCDRDGVCRPGDFVIAVNNQKVSHLNVVDIREKIVGPMGTSVILLFQRPNGEYYERTLIRGTPAYFEDRGTSVANAGNMHNQSRERSGNMQREVPDFDNLMSRSVGSAPFMQREAFASRERQSGPGEGPDMTALPQNAPQFLSRSLDVHTLPNVQPDNLSRSFDQSKPSIEGDLAVCKDELLKTKALLEQNKTDSMRYVKDIDTLQQKSADQVMKLQSLLNQSEQARRELEIQVANGRSREDEFQIVFARAKEQTEAREQYFTELKRQFEESRVNWERDITREKNLRAETERARDQARENLDRIQRDISMLKESDRAKREKEEEIRKFLQDAETKLVTAKQFEAKMRNQFQSMRIQCGQWQTDFFCSKSKEESDLEQFFLLA